MARNWMNTVSQAQRATLFLVIFAVIGGGTLKVADAFQRGGRGGVGARPSMGGGGMGGARPNMSGARPQMGSFSMPQSRPAGMPQSRPAGMPQMPSSRPTFGNASGNLSRPNVPSGQFQSPNIGGNRPNPQTRPGQGMTQRPDYGLDRPSLGLSGSNKLPTSKPNGGIGGFGSTNSRPSPGNLGSLKPGDRPNLQLPNMPSVNRPKPSPGDSGIANKPAPGLNRPNGIGSNNRPTIGGQRPQPLPGIIGGGGAGGGSGMNRPEFGNKPSTKPAPPVIGGNRPERPGSGGQGTFPGINNRPGINDRPGINGGNWGDGNWNRPEWNRPDGNRPNWGIGNGNWGTNNNFNNININNNHWSNNIYNRPSWDRPGWDNWGTHWGNGNWSNAWHDHCIHPHYYGWYNGCWPGYWGSSWYSPLAWGAVGWGLGSWSNALWNSTAFVNPYYTTPVVGTVASVPYDYSQPVVVNNYITADSSSAGSDASATSTSDPQVSAEVQQSFSDFDTGLAAFKNGNYPDAIKAFDAALRKNGSDPVIHEVRALALFATGDYNGAAAALNSLLASAPGMDWTTLSGLYGDPDQYTQQLRALEAFCKANPKNPASAFVLAYHYLVIGSKDSAIRALKVVVENQPNDGVAKRMLDALDPKSTSAASSSAPPPPAAEDIPKPQPEVSLTGKWKAVNGSSTIDLTISNDSGFTWDVTENGKKVAELTGDLATNGDAVVFETKEQGSLGGTVKAISPEEWVMLPPGVNKEDSGIRFKKVP